MIERGKKKDIGRELDDLRYFPFEARVFVENSLAWEEMLDFEKFHDEPNKKGMSQIKREGRNLLKGLHPMI